MALAPHTRLGPYEVIGPLGSGGMGEVYRACDTRLDRSVAIKVLSAEMTADIEMRTRFNREARAVAALDHPHICGVYDVGEAAGVHFLVMPLLEGQTLAARLEKGPLPIAQALTIAEQLTDALDKAHRRGIVHRDIKPANVMLTKAGATLLDFGLAKLKGPAGPSSMSGLAQAATSVTGTAHGMLLGTVPYMAPEQVEGREADARSDLWALGVLIYEMASGARPFTGESPASVIGAILKDTPAPLSTRQPLAPVLLDRIVGRCLEKDPDARWQSAADLHHVLTWTAGAVSGADGSRPFTSAARVWPMLATAAAAAALAFGTAAWRADPPGPARDVRFPVYPEVGSQFVSPPASVLTPQFALSHDGSQLAYVATRDGRPMLWVRPLAASRARALPGTEGAIYPLWSPDGRTIGFFSQGRFKTVRTDGGTPIVVTAASFDPRGGTWAPDGTVLTNLSTLTGLARVRADGTTDLAVPLNAAVGESSLRFPFFLPDSRHFVAVVRSPDEDRRGVVLGELGNPSRTKLVSSDWGAAVVDDHLLYLRGSTLMAQPLDLSAATLRDDPQPLLDRVGGSTGGYPGFAVSYDGTLAYAEPWPTQGELLWVDRTGRQVGDKVAPLADYIDFTVSPDGGRLALSRIDPQANTADIWILDLERRVETRLTSDRFNDAGVMWVPDGARVYFRSNRRGMNNLYVKPANGSRGEELVFEETGDDRSSMIASSLSADGSRVLYMTTGLRSSYDIMDLVLSPLAAKPLLNGEFNEAQPVLSPDGRWMAFTSDETGAQQVFIQSYPGGEQRQQVSSRGGTEPQWRGDGREIFYLSDTRTMMAAPVSTAGVPGTPSPLFQTRVPAAGNAYRRSYEVSPDGQRFLVNTMPADAEQPAIHVVLDWRALLTKP
jgi:Tol biopolymer transport system component